MNISRHRWFRYSGPGPLSSLALFGSRAQASERAGHVMSDDMVMPARPGKDVAVPARKDTETPMQARRTSESYTFVYTPNGWTLPHRTVDGVKEFHLDAEQIEHEFAPGARARCWGLQRQHTRADHRSRGR